MNLSAIKNRFHGAARVVATGMVVLALAACGGGGGSAGTVLNATTTKQAGSVKLLLSNPELRSSGAAGTEVTITAVVVDTNNNAMAGATVAFTADSGVIIPVIATGATTAGVTDAAGTAKATLATGSDSTNRTITVTATSGGKAQTATVAVVGTTVTISGPTSIISGATGVFTVKVANEGGLAVPNTPVTFSSALGNAVVVTKSNGGSSTAPLTNSNGQVEYTITAIKTGTDTLSASAMGAIAAPWKFNVSTSSFAVTVAATAFTSSTCAAINSRYTVSGVPQNSNVNISSSRGSIYSEGTCTATLNSSVPITNGDSQTVYVKSNSAGVATITAIVANADAAQAQADINFVAALTPTATISLLADPGVLGPSEQSTLTAVVRDGTSYNNFVEGAVVEFSIVSDKSGGKMSATTVVTTNQNGVANALFTAGLADTPTDGVQLQAKIQGTTTLTTAYLTVSRKSLFITAGTGNTVIPLSSTQYQKDYTVFVTDASGNPVSGVSVTTAVIPTLFTKGSMSYGGVVWSPSGTLYTCPNEDTDRTGIYTTIKDANGNGKLDPGIPVTVSSTATTDATGSAIISLIYPKDRAVWTEVQLTIRGSVTGTESTYQSIFNLPGLSSDYTIETVSPPGQVSPYGVNPCNVAN